MSSENSKRTRRQFSTEQKVAILRRHLADKVPVSNLCDEYKLQPSVWWQRPESEPGQRSESEPPPAGG